LKSSIVLDGTSIQTEGSTAWGLVADQENSAITATDVNVVTKESWSYGVYAAENGQINIDGGSINTEGERSFGILSTNEAAVNSSANITTIGDKAHGVQAGGSATATGGAVNLSGGTIKTSGSGAYALHAHVGGTISTVGPVRLETSGLNGY